MDSFEIINKSVHCQYGSRRFTGSILEVVEFDQKSNLDTVSLPPRQGDPFKVMLRGYTTNSIDSKASKSVAMDLVAEKMNSQGCI